MLALRPEFDYERIPEVGPAERRWYVVHSAPRAEWMVHRGLRRLGYDTLYLHYPGTVKHANRVIGVIKPLFPRYLFVGLREGQGLYDVNELSGVSTVLYGADGPYEVEQAVIEELRARGDDDGQVAGYERSRKRRLPELLEGQCVRIVDGPFRGYNAVVVLDSGTMIRLNVEVFRRLIEADVPPEAVKAV